MPLNSPDGGLHFRVDFEEHIEQAANDRNALDLARGQHLRLFRNLLPLCGLHMNKLVFVQDSVGASRALKICRLKHSTVLPDVVPLRITPRTPTETAFWIEKPLDSFRLEADLRL